MGRFVYLRVVDVTDGRGWYSVHKPARQRTATVSYKGTTLCKTSFGGIPPLPQVVLHAGQCFTYLSDPSSAQGTGEVRRVVRHSSSVVTPLKKKGACMAPDTVT